MTSRASGYALCALAMVTVGSTVIASKLIAAGLPPFTATALRFGVAFPILALLMHLTRTPLSRPGRRDSFLLLAQAGSGSVGYTVLLIMGMRLTSAATAGAIAGTLPAVAAVIAILLLGERPSRTVLAAVALAGAGLLLVTVPLGSNGLDTARPAMIGNLLVLGATVCEAIFILLNKKLQVPIRPLPLSTLMAGIGFLVSIGPALLERPWTLPLNETALLGVLFYALVPTLGGFLLWYAGSMRISGSQASVTTALAPVSALVLAAYFLREPIATNQLLGVAFVLAAITLPTLGKWTRPRPRPASS